MSGLLALLDDVSAVVKVAAASVDDIVGQATKAGAKAAGAVIDDAAVTPKYIQGFSADRELPIVGRIALGSIRNKLVFLLPAGLILSSFMPWAIAPLLMLGGAYLCFEGAEKVFHSLFPHGSPVIEADMTVKEPGRLEEEKVAGAIKTDFVLSAEIMTIALAAIPQSTLLVEALTLAVVAVGITVIVYGSVALIVKADDVGMLLALRGRFRPVRSIGRGIVRGMPGFLRLLTIVGTAAMLWVGGAIITHGMEAMGYGWLGHHIHDWASAAGRALVPFESAVEWLVKAALDGALGLVLGFALIPVATRIVFPLRGMIFDDGASSDRH